MIRRARTLRGSDQRAHLSPTRGLDNTKGLLSLPFLVLSSGFSPSLPDLATEDASTPGILAGTLPLTLVPH